MRGQCLALLPCNHVAEMIPGEENRSVGLHGTLISRKTARRAEGLFMMHPGTQVAWYVASGNVHGVGEFTGAPRYAACPPTCLLGTGPGGDSTPRMIAFQLRLEF